MCQFSVYFNAEVFVFLNVYCTGQESQMVLFNIFLCEFNVPVHSVDVLGEGYSSPLFRSNALFLTTSSFPRW